MSYNPDYDGPDYDDDLDDARADAAADAAWDALIDYHADSDCPAEYAGDDDCECAEAMRSDYRLDPVER